MKQIPAISTLTFAQLKHQLFHGNGCTFSELEAAEELAKRKNIKTLQQATKSKRVMTAKASSYILRQRN